MPERPPDLYKLPEGWSWEGDWEIAGSSDLRGEGWEYAKDFYKEFHRDRQLTDFVRRRLWVRKGTKKIASSMYFSRSSYSTSHITTT